ncbi:methylated-DNA--[protein]-cysteine S-methyltransferase [Anaerotignum sp.]
MEKIFFYENTPVGKLCIGEEEGAITRVTWNQIPTDAVEEETELIKTCKEELDEFFLGKRKAFDLPLAPKGTAFQKRVWDALREIPYGETRTYRDIAIAVDSPKGFRAVGMANHRNPIAILIPCHRVIGSDGKLAGYAAGVEIKTWLLALEQRKSAR